MTEEICTVTILHPELLADAKEGLPAPEEVARLAEMYRLLGDATRLQILQGLLRTELCVCDLAALTGISVSGVSHQLRLLRSARLVTSRREGKVVYYRLDDDHVATLLALGLEHVREG